MAGPDEAYNFVTKFLNLYQAGKKARIVLECEAGQAYVNLQLYLGPHHQQPPQNGQEHHQQPHRRPGPSRLRRRARRAEARAAEAAANAAPVSTDATVKAAAPVRPPCTTEAAVQAVSATSRVVRATTEAAPKDDPTGQAVQPQLHPQHHAEEATQPDQYLRDEFCPDTLFLRSLSSRAQREKEREEDLNNFQKMLQQTVEKGMKSFK